MNFRDTRYLFTDHWEYLDFKRSSDRQITMASSCREFTVVLKKEEGSTFSYTLTHRAGAQIGSDFQRFRATESRLLQFHAGCARIERDLRRHLRSGDPKWLRPVRPFGPLHGGIVLENGCSMWRGDKDDVDRDEWIDTVEDESLARLLCRADRLALNYSGEVDRVVQYFRSWELLKTIPDHHEFNVEVLRRRVEFVCFDKEFEDIQKAVSWARALVAAEPFNVINWLWLDDIIQRIQGVSAAVEVLREGLRHIGRDFTLHYFLSSHLCSLGRLDEAREQMLLALKQDPFALKSALESECFAPIHDFIREQARSDWFREESERWGIPDPL